MFSWTQQEEIIHTLNSRCQEEAGGSNTMRPREMRALLTSNSTWRTGCKQSRNLSKIQRQSTWLTCTGFWIWFPGPGKRKGEKNYLSTTNPMKKWLTEEMVCTDHWECTGALSQWRSSVENPDNWRSRGLNNSWILNLSMGDNNCCTIWTTSCKSSNKSIYIYVFILSVLFL